MNKLRMHNQNINERLVLQVIWPNHINPQSHKPSLCQFDFPKLLETMSLPMKLILTIQIERLALLEVFVDAPEPYSNW